MELDDLKNDWESATNKAHKQNILTSKMIIKMTQKKYESKIRKIKYPELTGGIICILGLSFIVFNFNKLDTPFLQSIGVVTILLLLIIPALSYLSLISFPSANNFDKPYIEIIQNFAKQKLRFSKYQKANAFLNYLLLVTIIILLPKFFFGKDITFAKSFWLFAFPIGYIFLVFFSKRVKKFYNNSLTQAGELLKEVEIYHK
ncbi:MAG TPA: hypothetical protein VN726_02435 [Hanamia sp.]|nr:hypothetical protein [Hanamia sp.]